MSLVSSQIGGSRSRATQAVRLGGFEGSPVALLENIGNSVAKSPKNLRSNERELENLLRVNFDRYRAWELRSILWSESNLRLVQQCGKIPITESGEVYPVATGKEVYYSGLASCKSVWACPCCSPRIHSRRREDLTLLCQKALESGSGAFGAYTLRHSRSDSLADLQQAISDCWSAVNRDGSVRRLRKKMGWSGVVLSREHTFTLKNGWHPHLHPLHFFEQVLTSKQVFDYFEVEFAVWKRAAERLGLSAPLAKAQNLHLVEISEFKPLLDVVEYVAKGNLNSRSHKSVAWEMAPGNKKTYTRSSGSLTPFDILEKVSFSITVKEKSKWLAIWHEYERATKGRSALTYSKGLREKFNLRGVLKDEIILKDDRVAPIVEDFGFVLIDWVPFKKNFRLGAGLLNAITPKGLWNDGREFCRKNSIDFVDLISEKRDLHIGLSRDVEKSKSRWVAVPAKAPPVISDWEFVPLWG